MGVWGGKSSAEPKKKDVKDVNRTWKDVKKEVEGREKEAKKKAEERGQKTEN